MKMVSEGIFWDFPERGVGGRPLRQNSCKLLKNKKKKS
jgi:hypothetical protein